MDNPTLIAIIVVAVVILAVVGILIARRRRSEQLRSRFGSEYDRALQEKGDRARAEAHLEEREKRVQRLNIRPLSPDDSARFSESWKRVQARFVDDPKGAITEADQLLGEVMSTRGYPVGDFEQRAADISVNYPRVVEHYRAGHKIALRHAQGEADTEDLRQAMIHYRTLFSELVGEHELTRAKAPEEPREKEERKIL